jgi:hypothetical protein
MSSNTRITIKVETDTLGSPDTSEISVYGYGDLAHFETAIRTIFAAEGFPDKKYLDLFEDEREVSKQQAQDVPVPEHDCLMTRHTDGIHCDKCGKRLPMSMCAKSPNDTLVGRDPVNWPLPKHVDTVVERGPADKYWLGDEFPKAVMGDDFPAQKSQSTWAETNPLTAGMVKSGRVEL